jgi:hypothetical protein
MPELSPQSLEDTVAAALRERYGVPVIRRENGQLQVLAGKPYQLARDAGEQAGFAPSSVVPIDLDGLPWFTVPEGGMELWRVHGSQEELATQLVPGDPPVQQVAEHERWHLVRAADGAMGWVPASHMEGVVRVDAPALAEVPVDADRFVEAALELLETPYRWGGTKSAGIDCSGLVQRSAWTAAQRWLPRHSTALLRVGERVAPSEVARGDVLVLRSQPDAPKAEYEPSIEGGPADAKMHVAIAEDSDTAIHASRDAWRVMREPLSELLQRYTVLGVRRLS